MKIKRTIAMQDGTEIEMEFELTREEMGNAYHEQEADYYHWDVITFLDSDCGMETSDAEIIGDDIWEDMYDYYSYNGDSDLSYWDNMRAAYREVVQYGWRK